MEGARVGRICKAVELATRGKLRAGTPVVVPNAMLDLIAKRNPTGYLRDLESLYYALRDQRYVTEDGRIVCVCMLSGTVFVHEVAVDENGTVTRWSSKGIPLPSGDWLESKRVLRSRKYRR